MLLLCDPNIRTFKQYTHITHHSSTINTQLPLVDLTLSLPIKTLIIHAMRLQIICMF